MFQADLYSSAPFEHFSFCLLQRLGVGNAHYYLTLCHRDILRPKCVHIFSPGYYFEVRLK